MAGLVIPEGVQEAVSRVIQTFLQGLGYTSQLLINEDKIREAVRTLTNEYGNELKAADEIAKSYWNWHIVYAATEGGATGATGLLGLAADIPALLTISLRLVQQMGICYGYDVRKEEEREYILQILRTGLAGSIKDKMGFLLGLKQFEQILLKVSWKKMTESLARKEISKLSTLAAIRQFAKSIGIQLTKRKALQMVPMVGAVSGALFNATFLNDAGRAAYMSYRHRRIAELEGQDDTILLLKDSNKDSEKV